MYETHVSPKLDLQDSDSPVSSLFPSVWTKRKGPPSTDSPPVTPLRWVLLHSLAYFVHNYMSKYILCSR